MAELHVLRRFKPGHPLLPLNNNWNLIPPSLSASGVLCHKTVLTSLINKIANALAAFLLLAAKRMGLLESNSAGARLILIEVVFFALAIGAVVLRIWSRRLKRRALGLDDYAVVVGLVWAPFQQRQAQLLMTWQIFAGGLLASEIVGQ